MDHVLRAIRPSDLEAVHQLQRRAERHDGIPVVTPVEEFHELLEEPHFDLDTDSRVVEVAGELAAWGRIWHQPSGVREERAYLIGAVDPSHRGRGIGTALLGWQMARAREALLRAGSALPRFIRIQVNDFQHSAIRLFERHGLTPVRYNDELLRGLGSIPPVAPIDGIAIVAWDPARSEEARSVQNAAFADHWGWTPRGRQHWEHELAAFGSRLDLSFFALDGDRIVGLTRNGHFPGDEAVTGRRDGWIMLLSVLRSHRKRGIASALIAASLGAFQEAGFTHAALGVDSENPTGAYQLYERLGFHPLRRSIVYQAQG
jgi:mycothiol synthase